MPALPFPVHSDPTLSLCAKPDEIYCTLPLDAKKKFGDDTEYSDTTLVQPAVVITDAHLNVTAWWSWRKIPGADASTHPLVPVNVGGTDVYLVSARPSAKNILTAVTSGASEIELADCGGLKPGLKPPS